MSASDFKIKFSADTSKIKSDLEKFRDYKLKVDLETDKLKQDIKKVFNLQDTKKDIQTVEKLYKEFLKVQADGEKQKQADLAKTAQKQAENAKQALAQADAQAKLNSTISEMKQKLDTRDVKQAEAEAQKKAELEAKALAQAEKAVKLKLEEADAQAKLNSVLAEMKQRMKDVDNRRTEQEIVSVEKLTKRRERLAVTIENIHNKNVKLIKDNYDLRQAVTSLDQAFDKATSLADFDEIAKQIQGVRTQIDITKSSGKTFLTQLSDNFTKFGTWSIITTGYFAVMRGIKDTIVQVQELDKQITELQKVTDLSGESLKAFTEDAFRLGEAVGRTGKDVVDATATFARAGYAVKDALDLAEVSLIMTNVGDGITDVATASDTLISILKGGNLTIRDSQKVLDSLNAVSNKNATSFDKLSQATTRYITVSTQAGQNLDQTLGLLTGVLEIMGGDSERAGRNLSTLTNRLLGLADVGEDGYEGVSKINTELIRLTGNTSKQVSVFDESTGQLRTAYDILEDLAGVYPELSKNAQVYLGNLIAGKNQIQAYNAIMTNFGAVTKATEDSMNSFGSSIKENETFLNSIEGKTNALSSAWSELSNNLWSSGAIKFFIDITTGVVKLADGIGILNIALGLLLGFLGAKGVLSKQIFNLGTMLVPQLATAMEEGSHGATLFATALNALPLIAIASGVMLLVKGISEANISMGEHAQMLEDTTAKLEDLRSEYSALNKEKELTDGDKHRIEMLQKEIELNEIILKQQQQKQYKMEFEGDTSLIDKASEMVKTLLGRFTAFSEEQTIVLNIKSRIDQGELDNAINYTAETISKLMDRIKEYEAEIQTLDVTNENGQASFDFLTEEIDKTSATIGTLMQYVSEWSEKLEDNIEGNIGVRDSNIALLESLTAVTDEYLDLHGAISSTTNELAPQADSIFRLSDAMNSLSSSTSAISTAYSEMSKDGELSISTVSKLIEAGDEYINLLQMENGHYSINQQKLEEIFEVKKQSYIADAVGKQEEIKNNIEIAKTNLNKLKTEAEAYKASREMAVGNAFIAMQNMKNIHTLAKQIGEALGYTGSALTQYVADTITSVWSNQVDSAIGIAEKAIADMQGQYDSLGTSIKVLSNLTLPAYAGTLDKVSGATSGMADSQKDLNSELDKAKSKLDEIVSKYASLKDAIVSVIDADIAKLGSFDFVDTLAGRYEVFKDYLLQGMQDEIDAIEKTADAEKQYWQDKIDALEAERKQEEQNKKLEEARLKIAEAQAELDKAKLNRENLQKNTRVFKAGEGWTWDFDPKAVADADKAIEDAQKKLEDAKNNEQKVKDDIAFEEMKKRYQEQIEEIEALKKAQVESVQAQIEALNKLVESWGNNSQEILDDILSQQDAEEFMKQWESANQAERVALLQQFSQHYKDNVDGQILKLTQQKDDFLAKYEAMRQELGLFTDVELYTQEFEKASYETRQAMLAKFTEDFKSEYNAQKSVIRDLENALTRIIALQAQVSGASYDLDKALSKVPSGGGKNPSSPSVNKPSGGVPTLRYAQGGTRLVDYTGKEKQGNSAWFDGTKAEPEVILNNTDAGRLYDLVHNKTVPVNSENTTNNNGTSIVIQKMDVRAEDADTLGSFIDMISQRATTR